MGLMPAGAANPFASFDQRTAYGAFKASGSFDPDALYAQKETMIAPYTNLKRLAVIGLGVGGRLAVTIAMAFSGIPILAASWLLWRFQAKQIANIEAGYAQYVGTFSG